MIGDAPITMQDEKVSDGNLSQIIDKMSGVGNVTGAENSKVMKVLNAVIRLIQVVGTGISVIMVTMLGIKYILASSSEKADVKKMAMPIIVGCALLFAASNLVAIIAGLGDSL